MPLDLIGQDHALLLVERTCLLPEPPRVVVLEGPSGTGRTTVLRYLAECLGGTTLDDTDGDWRELRGKPHPYLIVPSGELPETLTNDAIVVPFRAVPGTVIAEWLQRYEVDENDAVLIGSLSRGSPKRAVALLRRARLEGVGVPALAEGLMLSLGVLSSWLNGDPGLAMRHLVKALDTTSPGEVMRVMLDAVAALLGRAAGAEELAGVYTPDTWVDAYSGVPIGRVEAVANMLWAVQARDPAKSAGLLVAGLSAALYAPVEEGGKAVEPPVAHELSADQLQAVFARGKAWQSVVQMQHGFT